MSCVLGYVCSVNINWLLTFCSFHFLFWSCGNTWGLFFISKVKMVQIFTAGYKSSHKSIKRGAPTGVVDRSVSEILPGVLRHFFFFFIRLIEFSSQGTLDVLIKPVLAFSCLVIFF